MTKDNPLIGTPVTVNGRRGTYQGDDDFGAYVLWADGSGQACVSHDQISFNPEPAPPQSPSSTLLGHIGAAIKRRK